MPALISSSCSAASSSCTSHGGDVGQPARLQRYTLRRVTRIYPMYWIGLVLLLFSLASGSHGLPERGALATPAPLLPTLDPPVLGVA